MAKLELRLPQNAPGDFYVDSTCIDCDACRQIAPATFSELSDLSIVHQQPHTDEQRKRALMALVACPTASIGATETHDFHAGIDAFPSSIEGNVYYCGFNAESSFGAWSYLIVRPVENGGNVLVDSPRFASQLVKKIATIGGVRRMFLTHRDDVADHARFAEQFDCQRLMHFDDGASRLGIEQAIKGNDAFQWDEDLLVIPTPGHTRGSAVLLYRNKFLFTGDHLAWSPARQTLTAFRNATWYSWPAQIQSMERLLDYRFEWVLPGHGRIHHDTHSAMRTHLQACIAWMKRQA